MKTVREIFRSYGVLDADGRHVNGTDKETNHRYGDAYERIIRNYLGGRETVQFMMEVGVADGSSLCAWRDIFPNALCVGLDVHPSANAIGNRMEFHLGDATDRAVCERAAGHRAFDMIVDDATHRLGDILQTLLYLWPFVRMGGIYVVEEFQDASALRRNIKELWPDSFVVGTAGPHCDDEPIVVLRKQKGFC